MLQKVLRRHRKSEGGNFVELAFRFLLDMSQPPPMPDADTPLRRKSVLTIEELAEFQRLLAAEQNGEPPPKRIRNGDAQVFGSPH